MLAHVPTGKSPSPAAVCSVEVTDLGGRLGNSTTPLTLSTDSDATASSDNSETEGTPKLSDTPAPKR